MSRCSTRWRFRLPDGRITPVEWPLIELHVSQLPPSSKLVLAFRSFQRRSRQRWWLRCISPITWAKIYIQEYSIGKNYGSLPRATISSVGVGKELPWNRTARWRWFVLSSWISPKSSSWFRLVTGFHHFSDARSLAIRQPAVWWCWTGLIFFHLPLECSLEVLAAIEGDGNVNHDPWAGHTGSCVVRVDMSLAAFVVCHHSIHINFISLEETNCRCHHFYWKYWIENTRSELALEEDDDEPEPETTLFVKNLNFSTTDDQLKENFCECGSVFSAIVARKKYPKNPGQVLSMGYGFIQFREKKAANTALKTLQNTKLDGHVIELKVFNYTHSYFLSFHID